jgi:hypothetical protein
VACLHTPSWLRFFPPYSVALCLIRILLVLFRSPTLTCSRMQTDDEAKKDTDRYKLIIYKDVMASLGIVPLFIVKKVFYF